MNISTLSKDKYDLYLKHLVRLSKKDRYARFGSHLSDWSLWHYVNSIPEIDSVRILTDEENLPVAAVHISELEGEGDNENTYVELGISVLEKYRSMGLGSLLIKSALRVAKEDGHAFALVLSQTNNKPMFRIARKFGGKFTSRDGDTYALIDLSKLTEG